MSNLFKKGFASLALASAMASSVFAGDAAYIDVKVKYLSGTDKATLGHESWDATTEKYKVGARKDLVELYIRVLDKEGNLADKNAASDVLIPMILTRNGYTLPVNNLRADVSEGNITGMTDTATHSISRSVTVNKNVARYTLDYTKHSSATLTDNLIIKAGNLTKKFDVQLTTLNAKGLIVRATTKSSIDATFGGEGKYLNDDFKNIKLLGDSSLIKNTVNLGTAGSGSLSNQSHSIPQITAGDTIPLRIYASSASSTDENVSAPILGRFTMAPNLEGKEIVVVAVGDYNLDGNASIYLGQTTLTMKDGVAAGDMMISHGLPERITTLIDDSAGNIKFDLSKKFGGLGVAFIAYAKDNSMINNHSVVKLSNGALAIASLGMDGNNSRTDAIKVKSGPAAGFTGGVFDFNTSSGLASKLWIGNKTDVFVANSRGIIAETINDFNKTISITVVDKLGNPAILATSITAGTGLQATFKVNGNKQADSNESFDFNISNKVGMFTAGINGITTATLIIRDGNKTVALSSVVEASYAGQSLAGLTPFKFNVHTVDLVGNTPNDIVGDLRTFVKEINVTNSGVGTTIYGEKLGKDDYFNMKVVARVVSSGKDYENNNSVKLSFKAINYKGDIDSNVFFGLDGSGVAATAATKLTGGSFIEFNGTTDTLVTISTSATAGIGVIGKIRFKEVNTSLEPTKNLYKGIVGTTTSFILKANGEGDNNVTYRRNIDAYVATTTTSENAKNFVDDMSKPGKVGKTVIDFDFSGTLVEQYAGKAVATITFVRGSGASVLRIEDNNSLKAGIVGQPFVSTSTIEAAANTRVVKATIPDNKRLSVALYGAYDMASAKDSVKVNTDANKTIYHIQSITINGFKGGVYKRSFNSFDRNSTIVYTSRHGNKLTEAVDIDVNTDRNITVIAGDETSAAKVKIAGISNGLSADGKSTTGNKSGKDTKNTAILPNGLIKDIYYGTKPIKTEKLVAVASNTYYSLFSLATNLEIQDAYGNQADIGQELLEKNYVLSVSDTECAEVTMNKGFNIAKPAYIYFKPCAAGKEIDLIVAVSGNEEIKNTITFTNIVKKVENTKFILSLNVGDPDYNTVNNDIVIKVMPDGGTERPDATITVTSDNPDAKVKAVPVDLLIGREFGDLTGSGTTLKATINSKASYFVVTSDKPGKITVKADAIIPSTESVSGDDVPLTGTTSFTIVNVDTSAPTVTATSTSGSITVTVKDDGLDTLATKVTVNNMTGTETVVAKHTSNGVYVASGLKQGTYSINVYAMDLSGNVHKQTIVKNVGVAGGLSVEEEATSMLLAKKEYTVMGTFTSHKFGDDNAKNWIYTRKSDDMSFQLLGETPSDKDIFGWKKTDAKASTSNVWYMIKTGEGSFDWALANADGVAYKLKGAKSDNTFDFSGRLNLNVSHKDGMLTFTAK